VVVVVRVVVVVVCVLVVVCAPPVVVVCPAPPPPAGFAGAAAFAAGLAGAAGFLVSVAEAEKLAAARRPVRITAVEPYVMARRIACMIIVSSFLFLARALSRMRLGSTRRC